MADQIINVDELLADGEIVKFYDDLPASAGHSPSETRVMFFKKQKEVTKLAMVTAKFGTKAGKHFITPEMKSMFSVLSRELNLRGENRLSKELFTYGHFASGFPEIFTGVILKISKQEGQAEKFLMIGGRKRLSVIPAQFGHPGVPGMTNDHHIAISLIMHQQETAILATLAMGKKSSCTTVLFGLRQSVGYWIMYHAGGLTKAVKLSFDKTYNLAGVKTDNPVTLAGEWYELGWINAVDDVSGESFDKDTFLTEIKKIETSMK